MGLQESARWRNAGFPPINKQVPENEDVYYQCQRCGNCCKWPGDVIITEAETGRIAEFLQISVDEFTEKYTRLRANRQGLSIDDKPNGECLFLDGIDCKINAVKPAQCAGFPNQWRFPGWREQCEAKAIPRPE